MSGSEMVEELLPESIRQHILSFLNFTDVIRVSAVSKAWRSAASTLQSLIVSDDFIPRLNLGNDDDPPAVETRKSRKQKVKYMLVSAGCFLVKAKDQDLHIHKFSFEFRNKFSYFIPYLMQCVNLVGKDSIREFEFVYDISVEGYFLDQSLPKSVYAGKFLHKLVLRGLNLSLTASTRIDLPSLRELHLRCIQIDDEYFEQLTMNCPQLEIMKIRTCFGFHAFKVLGSHHRLKHIDFMKEGQEDYYDSYIDYMNAGPEIQKVEIKGAPNLEYFRYWGISDDILEVLDVAACKNLKVLEFFCVCGNEELLKSIEQLVSDLNNLEAFLLHSFTLSLSYNGLKRFKVTSTSLKSLWLGIFDHPMDVQLDAPQVSRIIYHGLISSKLSLGTSPVKEANFGKGGGEEVMYEKLLEFLRNFNHIEELKLEDFEAQDLEVPKHARNSLQPPLWDIKHLAVVACHSCDTKYLPLNFDLESLLWMAPQLDTLSFVVDFQLKSTITFQFIHGNSEINVEEPPSISLGDILFRVRVESCPCDAEGSELRKYYFFENEKFFEGRIKRFEVEVMLKKSW